MRKKAGLFLTLALSALSLALTPAGAYGARCFQTFVIQADLCTDVEGWVMRTACFLDAELELAACIARTV